MVAFLLAATMPVAGQTPETVRTELVEVTAQALDKTTVVPGELAAFQSIEVHAKVSGFVEEITVDRGSRVTKGQMLATLSAPELEARRAEALARIPEIEARRVEAEAKLAGAESTFEKLREAAKTPGVVAGNDVVLAGKVVEAERARIAALDKTIAAAEASVHAIEEIQKYLTITAPFDGVITERFAHLGSLVGLQSEGGTGMFRLEQMGRLRLVAAVPEAYTESIRLGARVSFTVPAYPGQTFSGTVARPAFAMDTATRTMPVELDVANPGGKLAPGMYAEVSWPIRRGSESLFVPPSAIKSTTERIFVIRVQGGQAEWVDVRRGMTSGNLVEVFGELKAGDKLVLRATDEIRAGMRVEARGN
jgi:RND family efflux transporter MFP subunit